MPLLQVILLLGIAVSASLSSEVPEGRSPNQEPPTCIRRHILQPDTTGRLASLLWQEEGVPGGRLVTVRFDGGGNALQYSELSTDKAIETFSREGAYRLVYLNFETGFAVVETQGDQGQRSQAEWAVDEVLASADLGDPLEVIRQVRAECASF